jgi:stress response protein YsnF
MRQTVVGIFDYGIDAQMAAQDLMKNGITENKIDIAVRGANERTTPNSSQNLNNPNTASTPNNQFNRPNPTNADAAKKDESFFGSLFDNKDESRKFSEAAKHGAIVTVHTDSREQAEKAAKLLDKCGAIDVDERNNQMRGTAGTANRSGGWVNTDKNSGSSIPVVEEKLNVGKRDVETGGVRMRSRIIEKPVEEHLRLREEHVDVERNKVNRPASKADMAAFKEGETKIVEHAEVPVVNKEARVVEEVKLNKHTDVRDETIRDTVRKQDIDIDKLDSDKDRNDLDRRDRDRNNL